MSTMTLPGFIVATISAVIRRGAGRPGISAVVMMMSTSAACAAYSSAALRSKSSDVCLGVAVGAGLRLLLGPLDPEELGAHRLDLLADLGSGVESAHHGAEAAGGTDGGEAGDAGADDEDLRRRHLAGRGDLAGEEAAELVGRLDDRAVAGDVGHRAEHVERLRARDARHGVHGEDGDPAGRELGDEVGVDRRADQAGQDRAVTKAGDLLVGRGVDLEDEVAGPHVVLGRRPARRPPRRRRRRSSPGRRPRTRRRPRSPGPAAARRSSAWPRRASPPPGTRTGHRSVVRSTSPLRPGLQLGRGEGIQCGPTLGARTCWRPARQGTHRGPSADQGLRRKLTSKPLQGNRAGPTDGA